MTVRRALITGGSRGIGAGITNALAAAGCSVAVTARTLDGLEAVAAAARDAGAPVAAALPADLADAAAVRALPAAVAEALGGPADILVHAAGIAENGAVTEIELEAWERSFAVNVTSAFLLAGALTPGMRARGWGRIVLVGSLYSRMGVARTAAYTSSKHALLGLTRVLSAELTGHGVTANAILPGFVDTEMVRDQSERIAAARDLTVDEVVKRFLRIQPIGRMVRPDEVGALAAYLCSEAAAAISGQGLHIDGGAVQA